MLTLRGFCLVLSTVMLRHFATHPMQATHDAQRELSINLLVGCCVAFCVLGKILAVASALRYPTVSLQRAWREFDSRRVSLEWLWLALQAWLLPASGYAQQLADAEHSGWPHSLLIIAWFLPSIVFLLALEFSATQLELDLALSIRPRPSNLPTHASRWWMRVRFGAPGGLMMCLVPVVFVLATIDLIQWIVPTGSETMRTILAVVTLAIGCLTLAPLWMKLWAGAKPLPREDAVSKRLESMCQQLHLSTPQLLCVGGKQTWQGAALVGWAPPFRQLWIGHSLQTELTADELDMVLLHELAHLRRYHCWLRLLPVLLCGLILVASLALTGRVESRASSQGVLAIWNLWPSLSLLVVGAAVAAALTMISRACELDADQDACIQASRVCSWAADRPACAASVLSAALKKLHGADVDMKKWYWLHPSIERRVQSLANRFPGGLQTFSAPTDL